MSYYQKINEIKLELYKNMYKNELEGNQQLTRESNTYINNLLYNLESKDNKTVKHNNIFNDTHNLIFQQRWYKLKPVHQKIKLKEYINNMNLSNTRKRKLINLLNKAVDDKILSKKGSVDYDPFTYTVKEIINIDIDNI